ncbi:Eco57I restriction-modification methylase domain-containing protein [Prevotella sp.]|uniref:Eco57I restriction-modification methylase domain-containing protein n=1 Tax=Prevotella sp. TaxID=59823 RepID=UPI003DA3378D
MEFKEYFQQPYQGGESFLHEVVYPIFGEDSFNNMYNVSLIEQDPELKTIANATGIKSICHVGDIVKDFFSLNIFDVTVTDHVVMNRNRVAIQKLIRNIMNTYSSAFMIFHYEDTDNWDWRFTFCSKNGGKDEMTDAKRYTFLLGPNQSCRTVSENFSKLLLKHGEIELVDIESVFDVEALSKEFFEKYKQQYQLFVDYMCDSNNGMRENFIDATFDHTELSESTIKEREEKPIRDYVKKMLGRIVFLHFLQKKGWMGVPKDEPWGKGDQNFMKNLFDNCSDSQKDNFLDQILEPLFSYALDKDRSNNDFLFDTKVSLDNGSTVKIPYLNGGLFERDSLDEPYSKFPAKYFENLFEFFHQYNFTIDENDPNDAQVGVDPEMLGRIFENLLEDNKDKGAFYTPKEIVQYMCRQSLITYLQTDVKEEKTKTSIEKFVKTYDIKSIGGIDSELTHSVNEKLKNIKICDPAIGSGAFPMGLLKELFLCRGAIENFDDAAEIKRHIIQHNIYGVDIEKGAVDIARLRFWLSLIVDEETPHSLPNLDYKIMQGNSLLEQYKGVDLSKIAIRKQEMINKKMSLDFFDEIMDVYRQELCEKIIAYYSCSDHTQKHQLLTEIHNNINKQIDEQRLQLDLKNIDIQANDKFFLWHTWFSDVFNRPNGDNGFDIVIGNPPYVQLQNNGGELAKMFQKCGYDTFARTGDIYCLFYECGWQLLKKGGILCFITSNKWMRAGYGQSTRKFFATKTNPKLLIDFTGVKIFESATVDTNILLFSKENNEHKTTCAVTNKLNKGSINNLSVFVEQNHTTCDFSTSDNWVILSPIEQSIKRKIEAAGTPLKDWDVQINYGIKTGYNDAFIISTDKREEILANCKDDNERKRTEELIRPILRGRDIKRYAYEWANLWLIYIPWHFPLQFDNKIQGASIRAETEFKRLYPAVYKHMLEYKEPLSKRNKAETCIRYEWYAMQRWGAKYWDLFFKPKICWKAVGRNLAFAIVEPGTFLTAPASFISANSSNEIILAYLCSSLGKYYIYQNSDTTGAGDIMLNIQSLIRFPIPKNASEDLLLSIKAKDELKIDNSIFNLYNFDEDEINFIKKHI